MLVVPPPAHACCWVHSPVQLAGAEHTLGVPPPPHVCPGGQTTLAPQQLTTPPQPSATNPQFCDAEHVFFTHGGAPQRLGVPPPPHVCPAGHAGHAGGAQSMR